MGIIPGMLSDEPDVTLKKAAAESVAQQIMKKYGDKAIRSGKEFLDEKKKVISVSPAIDIILGGGIPEGSFVIFTGDPKTGKTVTSLHFSGNCQRAGKKIYYLDVEGRLKQRDLEGIKGLDANAVEVIKSYKQEDGTGKIFNAAEWLDMAVNLAVNEKDAVIIIDSVSQLMTEDEATSEIEKQHRAPVSQLLSRFCKRVSNAIPINNNIIICIVHLIANISGFGAAKGRSGGRKIQYEVDVDLEIKRTEPWKVGTASGESASEDDGAQQIGQKVHWITRSTALSSAPGQKIVSWLRYGVGIDEVAEAIEIGLSLGLVAKKGAWFKLSCMENHLDVLGIHEHSEWEKKGVKMCQAQGQDKFITMLNDNPEYLKCLREDIKEMMIG